MRLHRTLYRTAKNVNKAKIRGGFWASNRRYATAIHPSYSLYKASFRGKPRIIVSQDSANKKDIKKAKKYGADAVVFPCWDYPGWEYVILNPKILRISKVH